MSPVSLLPKLLNNRELSALGVFALKEALPDACKKYPRGALTFAPFSACSPRGVS
jgi:hypothetical protein